MKLYKPDGKYNVNGKVNISGERMRQIRERQNMSQEQLAARLQVAGLNITQKSVSRMETGLRVVPDFELAYLAEALGVSINYLLGMDDPRDDE